MRGEQVSSPGVLLGAARACAVVVSAAAMAAPALAQDASRQFGQSPPGRQFSDQLVPDQTPAPAAKPAARATKPAGKPAQAAAKPRTNARAATAEGKAPTPSPASQEQARPAPGVAAQGAPAVASAQPSASPAPVPVKAATAAPASVQSGLGYVIGGLVALVAILAGLFVVRGRRRRMETDTEGKTGGFATGGTATANPPPQPVRMTGPALAAETPLAVRAAAPRKPTARTIAKTEPAPTPSPVTTVRRKRAVAESAATSAPQGAAADSPDLAPKAAAKPAVSATPKPAAKPAAGRRKSAAR